MSGPQSSPEHALASWSLSRELDAIRAEAVAQQGRVSRVLLRTPEVRLVVVGMARGSKWPEHTATGRVAVSVRHGAIELRTARETARLEAGMLAALEPRESHDVTALEDAAFLLIVAG